MKNIILINNNGKNMTEEIKKLETIHEVLSSLQLNLKVGKEQDNTFGKYKYRKAEDILEAVKLELSKELYPDCTIITQPEPKEIGGRFFISCEARLLTSDNGLSAFGYAELETHKKGMDLAQLTGAATSYAKKYALGNLFAIDDSKDDPDSKDNSKAGKPKNAAGFNPNGGLANGLDMKEKLDKKNQEDFAGLKANIESCGGIEELYSVRNDKDNKKIVASLIKYNPDLYEKIKNSVKTMELEFEEGSKI